MPSKIPPKYKICSTCDTKKSIDNYPKQNGYADGYGGQCRECKNKRSRERAQELYWQDPELFRNKTKDWYRKRRAMPGGDEYFRTKAAKQRSNPKYQKYMLEWNANNKELKAKLYKQWYEQNFDRVLEKNRKRRAMEYEAFVEEVDIDVLWDRQKGKCGICNKKMNPMDIHVDHKIPLCRGGEHSYKNTQLAHPSCNHRKHKKTMEEMQRFAIV